MDFSEQVNNTLDQLDKIMNNPKFLWLLLGILIWIDGALALIFDTNFLGLDDNFIRNNISSGYIILATLLLLLSYVISSNLLFQITYFLVMKIISSIKITNKLFDNKIKEDLNKRVHAYTLMDYGLIENNGVAAKIANDVLSNGNNFIRTMQTKFFFGIISLVYVFIPNTVLDNFKQYLIPNNYSNSDFTGIVCFILIIFIVSIHIRILLDHSNYYYVHDIDVWNKIYKSVYSHNTQDQIKNRDTPYNEV